MPSAELRYSNPFNTGNRPYLVLHMTGINGAEGDVNGLVDSGADVTQLPMGYASLMGYDGTTLNPMAVGTAGTVAQVLKANQACSAHVVGMPNVRMDFLPVFSPSPFVLWGRTDFMAMFVVTIDQANQKFTLQW